MIDTTNVTFYEIINDRNSSAASFLWKIEGEEVPLTFIALGGDVFFFFKDLNGPYVKFRETKPHLVPSPVGNETAAMYGVNYSHLSKPHIAWRGALKPRPAHWSRQPIGKHGSPLMEYNAAAQLVESRGFFQLAEAIKEAGGWLVAYLKPIDNLKKNQRRPKAEIEIELQQAEDQYEKAKAEYKKAKAEYKKCSKAVKKLQKEHHECSILNNSEGY